MALPFVTDHLGLPRALGNVPHPMGLLRLWRVFGDAPATPMVLRSSWDQYLRPDPAGDPWLQYVHDQADRGQCVAEATTGAIESERAEQGLPFVQLSPGDLYARINGGVDNGATLEDGMAQAMMVGVGTAATAGLLWTPGQPAAPAAERARYRVVQAFHCPTFEHCFSAVIAGFKLVSGVVWYENYNPDGAGWLPRPTGSPVGGHAIQGFGPTKRGGTYGIWHQNSWTPSWGVGGRFVLPETAYADGAVGGWWAVRQVVDEGGEVPAAA